jgi:hypothetical protein
MMFQRDPVIAQDFASTLLMELVSAWQSGTLASLTRPGFIVPELNSGRDTKHRLQLLQSPMFSITAIRSGKSLLPEL